MVKNYIKSLGVELEGGCNREVLDIITHFVENNQLDAYYDVGRDGSVDVCGCDIPNAELKFWHTDITKVKKFVKVCFENGFTQDDTCGNHIHIRIDEKLIPLLQIPSFYQQFIKEYKKNYQNNDRFLSRLNNRFCRSTMISRRVMAQLQRQGFGNRYAAINFMSLDEPQKTTEFRIFPHCSSYKEYEAMLDWFIATVNKLIQKQLNRQLYSKSIVYQTGIIQQSLVYEIHEVKNLISYKEMKKGRYLIKIS